MASSRKNSNLLLKLGIAAAIGLMTGCAGQSEEPSAASVVTVQGVFQDSSSVSANTTEAPFCLSSSVDPDGDGWGWENQRSCKFPQTSDNSDTNTTTASTDLPVGIVYYLWHCTTKTDVYEREYDALNLAEDEEFNITRVLNGQQSDWGNTGRFHWWDQPAKGYYCLGDQPDLIRSHLEMLRDAGIDFLVVDSTNHPNIESLDARTLVLKSLRPLLEVACTVPNSPRIVPWMPFASDNADTHNERAIICNANGASDHCQRLQQASGQSMYQHVTELMQSEFPNLTFEYQGKPLLLAAANDALYPREATDVVTSQLESTWTVRRMWGLNRTNDEWQFLTPCTNATEFFQSNGWTDNGCNQPINAGEQISVSAAYQHTYISEPFTENAPSGYTGGMPKFHGRTLAQQFRVAFDHRDAQPLVLLTGWNEWIAQRFDLQNRVAFVDLYDNSRNRDIEPGGAAGDFYYYLMRDLIAQYRNNQAFAFEDYFLTENSVFDADFYWNAYADVQNSFAADDYIGLRNHWLTSGMQEGRQPSVLFNADYYGSRYPTLVNSGLTTPEALLRHYIDFGFQEGRQGSSEFHAPVYINQNPVVARLFGNNGYYKAYKYYLEIGQFTL